MKIKECRICKETKLKELFSFGNLCFTGKFPTKNQKIEAILDIIKDGDPETLLIINNRIKEEQDLDILKSLEIAKYSIISRYGKDSDKINAIKKLSGNTNNDLVNILKSISEDDSLPINISSEANKSLSASLQNIRYNNIIKTTFFGLSDFLINNFPSSILFRVCKE